MTEARGGARVLPSVGGGFVAAWLAAFALGCATAQAAREDAAATVLLAPLNVFVGMPSELTGSADRVSEAMRSYLESHGKRVEALSLEEARGLWARSILRIERAHGPESFSAAASLMARQLARRRSFEVLVLPALYHRHANAAGGSASWDGAEARIRLRADDAAADTPLAVRGYHGPIGAASLFVAIVSPGGGRFEQQISGLELTEHIAVVGGLDSPVDADRWIVESDSPALDDDAKIREGIARAFSPYLPVAEAAARD